MLLSIRSCAHVIPDSVSTLVVTKELLDVLLLQQVRRKLYLTFAQDRRAEVVAVVLTILRIRKVVVVVCWLLSIPVSH